MYGSTIIYQVLYLTRGCPGDSVVKDLPTNTEDSGNVGSIPGSGRSPGVEHGNPLQYSCLENPHGQRSLAVHGVTQSQTRLKRLSIHMPIL